MLAGLGSPVTLPRIPVTLPRPFILAFIVICVDTSLQSSTTNVQLVLRVAKAHTLDSLVVVNESLVRQLLLLVFSLLAIDDVLCG